MSAAWSVNSETASVRYIQNYLAADNIRHAVNFMRAMDCPPARQSPPASTTVTQVFGRWPRRRGDGQIDITCTRKHHQILALFEQHHHLRQYFCNAVGSTTDYYDITSSRIINNFVANYLVDDAGWGECSESRNRYRCNSPDGSLSGLIEINGRRERSVSRIAHSDLYCVAACSQPAAGFSPQQAGWRSAETSTTQVELYITSCPPRILHLLGTPPPRAYSCCMHACTHYLLFNIN
jgi:hypothetical protein